MKFTQATLSLLALSTAALAQKFDSYTDDDGIKFWQSTIETEIGKEGIAQWGLALPAATQKDHVNEYIGRFVVPIPEDGTWMGISHSSSMTKSLLLVTWPDGEEVKTSFRYASGYVDADVYTGDASLSIINSNVNDTHYSLTYRCQNCWKWDQDGDADENVPATSASAAQVLGWAQATQAPSDPGDPDTGLKQHAEQGMFAATVASARNSAYTSWISLATSTPAASAATGTDAPYPAGNGTAGGATATASGAVAAATAASTGCSTNSTITSQTWDYIVVGSGAGGIPLADKLSEDGASVLLVERGPPSSARWGGTMRPDWLKGTNLTRFDVPGMYNMIWEDSEGIACDDVGTMAGCVLGGGTAVNAGLWWKANPTDFDYNFPEGWKSEDVWPAVERVFNRVPYEDRPSTDGIIYKPQGYDVVAGALAAAGWKNVTADEVPAQKNFTFSRPNHMFGHGERGGPMATYLVSASERKNFKFVTNTNVNRVVREGTHITGIETEAFLPGGQCGTIKVTPKTGKVILSAGAFGTPKILYRSGIGPQDQLEIVKEAEGDKMVSPSEWIKLPVGHNLDDHPNTEIVISHPNVSSYDWSTAYTDPPKGDKDKYLNHRKGILAQASPNLAAVFWQEVEGADGITRALQWTARVEASHDIEGEHVMTLSQNLGRGSTGRGKIEISSGLDMSIAEVPYLKSEDDVAAVKTGIETLRSAISADPKLNILWPPHNQTLDSFLKEYPLTASERSSNHWMGTCKMGLDSGLEGDGTAVVDTDTKVYGTDNLFVVDASVFPGMVSTNPSALIATVAEHASEKILALGSAAAGNA